MSPAKTAEPIPIKMPFAMQSRVDARNHVLDGGPDFPTGRCNFEGEEHAWILYVNVCIFCMTVYCMNV